MAEAEGSTTLAPQVGLELVDAGHVPVPVGVGDVESVVVGSVPVLDQVVVAIAVDVPDPVLVAGGPEVTLPPARAAEFAAVRQRDEDRSLGGSVVSDLDEVVVVVVFIIDGICTVHVSSEVVGLRAAPVVPPHLVAGASSALHTPAHAHVRVATHRAGHVSIICDVARDDVGLAVTIEVTGHEGVVHARSQLAPVVTGIFAVHTVVDVALVPLHAVTIDPPAGDQLALVAKEVVVVGRVRLVPVLAALEGAVTVGDPHLDLEHTAVVSDERHVGPAVAIHITSKPLVLVVGVALALDDGILVGAVDLLVVQAGERAVQILQVAVTVILVVVDMEVEVVAFRIGDDHHHVPVGVDGFRGAGAHLARILVAAVVVDDEVVFRIDSVTVLAQLEVQMMTTTDAAVVLQLTVHISVEASHSVAGVAAQTNGVTSIDVPTMIVHRAVLAVCQIDRVVVVGDLEVVPVVEVTTDLTADPIVRRSRTRDGSVDLKSVAGVVHTGVRIVAHSVAPVATVRGGRSSQRKSQDLLSMRRGESHRDRDGRDHQSNEVPHE